MKNFKKVVLTFISVALVLVPSTLFAATVEVKNEEELFKAISSDNTIILQSDVTLTKALEIKGSNVTIDLNGNTLTVENGYSDEVVASYNTYKCKALPSGPICNPGVDNINAVIEHNDTDYYYFFSDLKKKFHFAKNYSEFETLKQKYPWQ